MININFKPCCQDCTVIKVDTQEVTYVNGDKSVKIHCAHDVVCGRFNKEIVFDKHINKDCRNCERWNFYSRGEMCINCNDLELNNWKKKEVEND